MSDSNQIDQIEGMTELNGREFLVKVIKKTKFSIGDTSQFHPYEKKIIYGYENQIILPKTMHFKEIKDALNFDILKTDTQVVISFFSLFKSIEEGDISVENIIKTRRFFLQ